MGFALIEVAAGRFLNRSDTTRKDVIVEVISTLAIPVCIAPVVLFMSPLLVEWVVPGSADAWAHWSFGWMFLVLLLADDLTQYGWHRTTHTVPWLYAFHRAHHSGRYMSVRVVYRNSLPYYAFMPGLWLSAGLIHLGFGPCYMVYVVLKMMVIIGAHSSVPWDEPLRKYWMTRPFMWWVTRIISTPLTHSAHHGRHRDDGVTHYKGNYGNFLFVWDVIFGSAKVSETRPESYGIENEAPTTWLQELVWPWRKSR